MSSLAVSLRRGLRFFAWSPALVVLIALAGCDGPQCALDTDCPLGQRCTSENRCVARGGGDRDTGAAVRDAGGDEDAPAASDAAVAHDAAVSPPDGGAGGCPVFAPSYPIASIEGCSSGATELRFMLGDDTEEACVYALSSDVRSDLEGTFTLMDTQLEGGLNFFDEEIGRSCTIGTDDLTTPTVSCGSGSCVIQLGAP